tara:strand:- start:316 stop:444 length:129 start_codon:yes stop_codon:yes gene_type:complete
MPLKKESSTDKKPQKPLMKAAKEGFVKRFSKIARPQRFRGIF